MSGAAWEARYRAERTPWERPVPNPAFVAWRAAATLAPCRILLPGAGRSIEPSLLARDGFDVTVVDLAAAAAGVQRVRLHTAGYPATVVQADLLDWEPETAFDAIYDQTCLCALDPTLWPAYAARLHRWLRPGGRLFVLFMQTGQPGGPPFDCPLPAMHALFGPGWDWPDPSTTRTDRNEIPAVLRRR